jgi:hypothetical protein
LGDIDVDGRIILRGTSKNWDGREFIGSIWLKVEAGGVLL